VLRPRQDNLKYGWIDTICLIHKDWNERTPAEMKDHDEAINSMYKWFACAEICYAYLDDVDIDPPFDVDRRSALKKKLLSSHWFTSGWTLMELIAPPCVVFYQANWHKFGTKKDMCGIISKITGIPKEILTDSKKLKDYSIFDRMSWARHRMTSGIDDQAYCLMGLFEVHLKYEEASDTEESDAFLRLRQAIKDKHGPSSLDQPAAPLRLLRIETLTVESHPVSGGKIPEYAILSHTWDGEEITFQDIQCGRDFDERKKLLEERNKRSYDKIIGFCKLAEENGFEYVWVDTCCIDRTSSSELQEAICSMWRWYKNAQMSVCSSSMTSISM